MLFNKSDMNTNRCGNCGGEQLILGRAVKCFDCGFCHGDDPTTTDATVAVANEVMAVHHDAIHVSDDRPELVDEDDAVFQYERGNRLVTIRCVEMIAGDTEGPVPLVPGIHRSFYEGVDEVGVYFIDRDEVQRYEARPYYQRTHAASRSGTGASV